MAKTVYNTLETTSVIQEEREFRITLTHITPSDKYTVGIREYVTSSTYTGFSAKNGVTIPMSSLEFAKEAYNNLVSLFG